MRVKFLSENLNPILSPPPPQKYFTSTYTYEVIIAKGWWLIFLVLIDVQLSVLCINVETHCYVSWVVVTKYKTNTLLS